jgi:uncharacterized protein YdeI (YjbR/CyaY-like superfamily)
MRPDGIAAFESRRAERSGIYSYEQRNEAKLPADFERRFREHERAWAFFEAQPPGYRQTAIWWIVTAKREEARVRRLERLIADSEAGRRTAR